MKFFPPMLPFFFLLACIALTAAAPKGSQNANDIRREKQLLDAVTNGATSNMQITRSKRGLFGKTSDLFGDVISGLSDTISSTTGGIGQKGLLGGIGDGISTAADRLLGRDDVPTEVKTEILEGKAPEELKAEVKSEQQNANGGLIGEATSLLGDAVTGLSKSAFNILGGLTSVVDEAADRLLKRHDISDDVKQEIRIGKVPKELENEITIVKLERQKSTAAERLLSRDDVPQDVKKQIKEGKTPKALKKEMKQLMCEQQASADELADDDDVSKEIVTEIREGKVPKELEKTVVEMKSKQPDSNTKQGDSNRDLLGKNTVTIPESDVKEGKKPKEPKKETKITDNDKDDDSSRDSREISETGPGGNNAKIFEIAIERLLGRDNVPEDVKKSIREGKIPQELKDEIRIVEESQQKRREPVKGSNEGLPKVVNSAPGLLDQFSGVIDEAAQRLLANDDISVSIKDAISAGKQPKKLREEIRIVLNEQPIELSFEELAAIVQNAAQRLLDDDKVSDSVKKQILSGRVPYELKLKVCGSTDNIRQLQSQFPAERGLDSILQDALLGVTDTFGSSAPGLLNVTEIAIQRLLASDDVPEQVKDQLKRGGRPQELEKEILIIKSSQNAGYFIPDNATIRVISGDTEGISRVINITELAIERLLQSNNVSDSVKRTIRNGGRPEELEKEIYFIKSQLKRGTPKEGLIDQAGHIIGDVASGITKTASGLLGGLTNVVDEAAQRLLGRDDVSDDTKEKIREGKQPKELKKEVKIVNEEQDDQERRLQKLVAATQDAAQRLLEDENCPDSVKNKILSGKVPYELKLQIFGSKDNIDKYESRFPSKGGLDNLLEKAISGITYSLRTAVGGVLNVTEMAIQRLLGSDDFPDSVKEDIIRGGRPKELEDEKRIIRVFNTAIYRLLSRDDISEKTKEKIRQGETPKELSEEIKAIKSEKPGSTGDSSDIIGILNITESAIQLLLRNDAVPDKVKDQMRKGGRPKELEDEIRVILSQQNAKNRGLLQDDGDLILNVRPGHLIREVPNDITDTLGNAGQEIVKEVYPKGQIKGGQPIRPIMSLQQVYNLSLQDMNCYCFPN